MSIAWEEDNTITTIETQEFSIDPIINRKIKTAVHGLQKSIQNYFLEFPTERDKELVADFLISCSQKENVAIKTKRVYLIALTYLSRFLDNKRSFDVITAKELTEFLNSRYKDQTQDPKQSWISTQRTMGLALQKFFKWLAYPDLTPKERSKLPKEQWPPVLKGFVLQRKKGALLQSPVTQRDIWDDKDLSVFLKYCTDNPRLRLYHALAYETSARPGELLQLKIGDITDNIQTDENGKLCAIIDVGRYGKKKESRKVGITDLTIQYYQPYLLHHSDPKNRKAFLFVSREHSAMSRNIPISNDTLRSDYTAFRDRQLPKILKRPDIPEEDKKHLASLRDTKKWCPYIMRHSSLSKLAHDVNDYTLREHAGWSKNSGMVDIYTHTLTEDSAHHVMALYGINLKDSKKKRNEQLRQEMIGPHCPFCKMVNIPNSQFCASCHRPMLSTSIDTITQETQQTKKELEQMRQLQQQQAERLTAVTAKSEEMNQRLAEALGALPLMNPKEANIMASKLLHGLPGQRAYEERQRKKRAENILYGE